MICPWCNSENLSCKDSRPSGIGRRRRYRCGNCGGRFSTMELPVGLEKERGPSQRGPLRHKGRDTSSGPAGHLPLKGKA